MKGIAEANSFVLHHSSQKYNPAVICRPAAQAGAWATLRDPHCHVKGAWVRTSRSRECVLTSPSIDGYKTEACRVHPRSFARRRPPSRVPERV